jgi:alkylhydroperoxidase family enzyme
MSEPADLELVLRRRDAVRYAVDIVFSPPGSEADVRPLGQQAVSVTLGPIPFR